jgi:prepilin-type N-terminal cleavage/methylation domain-containing protein
MISAARANKRPSGGFSLLEIVIVLAIASMVMAGAIGVMVLTSSERELKQTSSDIEVLAKRARMTAMLQQRPYALVFQPGMVRLMPLADLTGSNDNISRTAGSKRSSHSSRREESEDPVNYVASVYDQMIIDGAISLSLRRWASDQWIPMDERRPQVWRFDPDGICEPITMRLANNQNSWIENSFHPLTASVSDTSAEFR